jgi:hypothetical protein
LPYCPFWFKSFVSFKKSLGPNYAIPESMLALIDRIRIPDKHGIEKKLAPKKVSQKKF